MDGMVTIAHATAATREDAVPFAHAVALAYQSGAKLKSVHASDDPRAASHIADANALLTQWGLQGSIDQERVVHSCCEDPVDTTLDALGGLNASLVVTGTHQREGVLRFLLASRAEAIAQNVAVPTLVVPITAPGFVEADGRLRLNRVLVPVGDDEAMRFGCDRTRWFLELAGAKAGEAVLLHVGKGTVTTENAPLPNGWTCVRRQVGGNIEDAIVSEAANIDLIVMATRGHDSITDALVGSHTERVLHRAPCPVLSVPMKRA